MQWVLETNLARAGAAAEIARKAVAQKPDSPGPWQMLSRVLFDSGQTHAAQDCLREAIARLPGHAALHVALAGVLQTETRHDEALTEVRKALALSPDNPAATILSFELYVVTRNRKAAAEIAAQVAAIAPDNKKLIAAWENLFGLESLLSFCEARLAANPAHTNARFFKALALAKLGRPVEACESISLDRFVQICDLPVPEEFEDAQSFRRALAGEIQSNPSLKPDPFGKATRGGLQTAQLRQPGAAAVDALLGQIRRSVDDYEHRLEGAPQGFATARPKRAELKSWAVVYGKDGRQASHRHPDGWLSGVFYVAAPRSPGRNAYQGPLVLGALDLEQDGIEPPWGTCDVEPVPGRLALFPSFMPHATESTGVEGARISVAFDVVPADLRQAARAS